MFSSTSGSCLNCGHDNVVSLPLILGHKPIMAKTSKASLHFHSIPFMIQCVLLEALFSLHKDKNDILNFGHSAECP